MARPNYRDLTHEQLVSLLEARDRKKFGLIWERDAIEADRALNSDFVVLDELPELGAGDGVKPNLIIEGDNFDALRALKVAYAGKVKCIYIDPPYNTGNRDFVYNDRFVDKDHNWRHSLWLEFMFQRLTLARDLLAQDGAIFVSIDDNEIFHLGLLMNEVFGEGNFVANVLWQKRYSVANDHKTICPLHDYVLVYRQSLEWQRNLLPRGEEKDKQYRYSDNHGTFRVSDYTCNKSAEERPNLYYAITQPNSGEEVWPKRTRVWAYSKEEHLKHLNNGMIFWGKDGMGKVPSFKRYKHLLKNDGVVPDTWWTHTDAGHNDIAKKELMAALPDRDRSFSTPKPTSLIERILQIATNPGDLVLDFFAGSGTTGHAVLKMNAANPDQAPRRFILVSNTEATLDEPEKNLCRDVCRQRVANVISGYGDVPGTGGAFAYLRMRRIPLSRVVRRIEHPQVWLFLQLMHFGDLAADAPLASGRLHARRTPEQSVFYPTTLTEALLQRLDKEREHAANVTIYTWQPEALAMRMESPGISILPIPQTLIDRFGPRP
jgi:adenine-specific DNA-methyltransferase